MAETPVQLSEEIYFQNNTATLFHRTRLPIHELSRILKSGWSDSGSGLYGRGIYTTYKIEQQLTSKMSGYGNTLLKFKRTTLKNIVFFSPKLAKKVHPDGPSIKEQVNKIYPNHKITDEDFEKYQSIAERSVYTSEAAKKMYDDHPDIVDHLPGIEYFGSNDGPCILVYPPAKDMILLAAADLPVSANIDVDDINWVSVGAVRQIGTKVFGLGLYGVPSQELKLNLANLDKSRLDIFKNVTSKEKWEADDIETLLKAVNSRFAFRIITNNEKKFKSPSDINYSILLEKFIGENDKEYVSKLIKHVTESTILDERSQYSFLSRLFVNPNTPPLGLESINHLIDLVQKHNAFNNNTFYTPTVLLFFRSEAFNDVSSQLKIFDRLEQVKPKGFINKYTVAYNQNESFISTYIVNNFKKNLLDSVLPHVENKYFTYGETDYYYFVQSIITYIKRIDVFDKVISVLDGPNHDQLEASFLEASDARGQLDYKKHIVDYLIKYKSNDPSLDEGFVIETYVESGEEKNIQDLNVFLLKLGSRAVDVLNSEFAKKPVSLVKNFFNLDTSFLQFLPYIKNYSLADYLKNSRIQLSLLESTIDFVVQVFAKKEPLDLQKFNDIVSVLSENEDKFEIFLNSIFSDLYSKKSMFAPNVFSLENILFVATNSLFPTRKRSIPQFIREFYVIAPDEFNAYKTQGADWLNTWASETESDDSFVALATLLTRPINMFPWSSIDAKFINRMLGVGSHSFQIDVVSDMVDDDKLFAPTNDQRFDSIVMFLLATPYSTEVLNKIKKFNPSFFENIDDQSLLSVTDDDASRLRNIVSTRPNQNKGWNAIFSDNISSVFDELKKNKKITSINTFVKFYINNVSIYKSTEQFVEFIKFLLEWKGSTLSTAVINSIVSPLDQRELKTNSERVFGKKGLSEVVFTMLENQNKNYLTVVDSQHFPYIYKIALNKIFILEKYLSSRSQNGPNSDVVSEMYDLTPDSLKGKFVQKIFADTSVVFTVDLVTKLLASTQTPKIAEILLNRADLDKWTPYDIRSLFTFNDSINSPGVKAYVYKRIAPYFKKFTEDDTLDFLSGITSIQSMLYFLANKSNITKVELRYLIEKAVEERTSNYRIIFDSAGPSVLESIAKTINRYHRPEVMSWFIEYIGNPMHTYSGDNRFADLYLRILDLQKNRISPFAVRNMLNTLPESYSSSDALLGFLTKMVNSLIKYSGSDIDPELVGVVLEYMIKKQFLTKTSFSKILTLFLEATKTKLNDRLVFIFLNTLNNSMDMDQSYQFSNYILKYVGPSVTTSMIHNILTYGIDYTSDIDAQNKDLVRKIIDTKKNKLTRDDIKALVLDSKDMPDTINRVKDYVDNTWLQQMANAYNIPVKITESLIQYSDYYTMKEIMTPASQMDLDQAFDVFDASYKKATGKSWDKQKFISRASNWIFFGDNKGYVAVRPQRGGMVKLVGVAGSPKSILSGFHEMTTQYTNTPIWGAVSMDIADMTVRVDPNFKKLTVPGGMIGTMLFNVIKSKIPSAVFGGAVIKQANADGTITFDYPDVGETNKVLVGNKEYFEVLKGMILSDPRLAAYQSILNKLL